jgi:hypothetical protein
MTRQGFRLSFGHLSFRQVTDELMSVKGKIGHTQNVSPTPWRVNYPKG